jgi:A/G-specific adenine glycosylase
VTAVARKHRSPEAAPPPAPAKPKRPPTPKSQPAAPADGIADALLSWYDNTSRDLPWRIQPTARTANQPDPYRIWLSEVMLQQTTVKTVIPYFQAFLRRWPSVEALAKASLDEVLAAWAGLGYYSRARNLHKCACASVAQYGGRFPATEAELLELPGIGPYTAAAVAAIAFGERTTPVDGNVERVVARLFDIATPLPAAKPELRDLAATLTPITRAGDFAQATMDLGATVCTPKRPSCMICPLSRWCKANAAGTAAMLPVRTAKGTKPLRRGVTFLALREDGHVLMRKRPDTGLLAGMLEVPGTEWSDEWLGAETALRLAPVNADWWPVPGIVTHIFTHLRLELLVYRAVVPSDTGLTLWSNPERCRWVSRNDLKRAAVPSLFRKVLAHAMGD